MPKLNPSVRAQLGERLKSRLPSHWRVNIGGKGHPFVELDQDGRRPDHQFPALGSTVIMIAHSMGDAIDADVYKRVKQPPGYAEARSHQVTLASVSGRGWAKAIEDAVVEYAIEVEASLTTSEAAEA